jgi:hypothetical protein
MSDQVPDALTRSLPRGSMARGGRSLVGVGDLIGSILVPAGGAVTIQYTIDEPGVLDRYMLNVFDPATGFPQAGLTVNSINLDNDNLISGAVGANLFTDQTQSPYLGHRITQNTKLRVTLGNTGALPLQVTHGFTIR